MLSQPHIVFIQAESLDGRALGFMGESGGHTPFLDALAAQGVVFEQAYCNSPQCCPSRASMWSGRHVHQVGAWNNYLGLPTTERVFTDELMAAGYQVGVVGRTDHRNGSHSVPARMSAWVRAFPEPLFMNRGPKHNLNEEVEREHRGTDWVYLREATEFLEDCALSPEEPFFLHVGLTNTHPGGGYNTSPYWLQEVDAAAVSLPPPCEERHPVMREMQRRKGCLREPWSDDFVRTCRHHYLAMIAEVDGIVGELVDHVDLLGLGERTVVIFTADHGDQRLEHGQYLKNTFYEGSARVPLVMAGPGIKAGSRVTTPVSLLDIYPTLTELAGQTPGRQVDGTSLVAAAGGSPEGLPGVVFGEYHSNFQQTGSFMLRRGQWKYLAYPGYEPQLFDLEADPDELNDLAASRPEVVAELDRELREIVDYERVDAAVKALDRAELAAWKVRYPGDGYLDALGKMAHTWSPEIAEAFRRWLEEGERGDGD